MKFSPFSPDLTDLDTDTTDKVSNVLPRGDGYGPFPSFTAFTNALAASCRGYFYARKADGSVAVFAGTLNRLYLLDNTTLLWTNVTKVGLSGGNYPSLVSTDNWRFAQFNNFVIAVQVGAAPQVLDLTGAVVFADLGGSPPQATHVSVVGRFLVLSGLSGFPYRIQWCGLNATTTWDNVTAQSNFQDLPDGGLVHEVAGGEYGIIFQDTCIRRMTFAPGAPYTFQIDRIAEQDGLFAKYGVIRAGDEIHFVSPQGFKKIPPNGYPTPIGKERVDRTFFADVDTSNLQLLIGATDPTSTRVYWAYKSIAGQAGLFDSIMVYDRVLDVWSKVFSSGEYLATLAAPGITLEALDKVAPGVISVTNATTTDGGKICLTISGLVSGLTNLNTENAIVVYGVTGTTEANSSGQPNSNWKFAINDSTHITLIGSTFVHAYVSGGSIGGAVDALTLSLDAISISAQAQLSMINSSNVLGFFSGANLEAIIETTEADLGGERIFINGFRAFTDATSVFGSLWVKDTPMATAVQTAEQPVNAIGVCPQRIETRYARARMRIPAGTTWTYAMGVEPVDSVVGGER